MEAMMELSGIKAMLLWLATNVGHHESQDQEQNINLFKNPIF